MLKMNKVTRQVRAWSAVLANVAKAGYYGMRAWRLWEKSGGWLDW